MNNAVFGKTMKNIRNYRDIKLITSKGTRNYSVSKPNYYTTKVFLNNLLAVEIKKYRFK